MKFITAPEPEPEAPANLWFHRGQVDCALEAYILCGHFVTAYLYVLKRTTRIYRVAQKWHGTIFVRLNL